VICYKNVFFKIQPKLKTRQVFIHRFHSFCAVIQEHQFGYPYQLGHQETADHPQDAMLTHIAVRLFAAGV